MLADEQMPAPTHGSTETVVLIRHHTSLLQFIPSLYTVAALAVLAGVFVVALLPRIETDFWWHIKVGQVIANQHIVPSRDFMSFTFAGHSWTDHEWLAELFLYGLYQTVGLWGPIVLFATVICAAFCFVYATMVQRNTNRIVALFLLTAAFTASRGSWGPRIQMLSMLFLAVYAFVLQRYLITRDHRLLLAFPLVMLVWTNVHGGFVLGLVIMAITVVGEWLNRVTYHEDSVSKLDIRDLALALLGTGVVTVINPNGLRQLLYPLAFVLPNTYTNQIQESASPNFHMLVMMIFEVLLLLLVTSSFLTRPKLNWTNLLLILAFTHLALSQVRNVPLWTVVVTPLLATYLQAMGPALQEQFPWLHVRKRPVRGRIGPILNAILLAAVVVLYAAEAHVYITPKALATTEKENFPIGAVSYLQHHKLPPRVFVSYAWGGYLLWNLFPKYRDFMDSRADTLFDARILRAYLDVYSGAPRWRAVLNEYRIQDVLIEPDAPLAQLLAQTRTWRLVYHDKASALYTRR